MENEIYNNHESRIVALETKHDNLKEDIEKILQQHQEKVWGLVTIMFRVIMVLIGIITLFAGIKLSGLLDLASKM